jgi:subtilisin family serine protease
VKILSGPLSGASPADSGVDCSHPDLADMCVDEAMFVGGSRAFGPGAARDEAGHGTHMAGLIAASGNGKGTVGVLRDGVSAGRTGDCCSLRFVCIASSPHFADRL